MDQRKSQKWLSPNLNLYTEHYKTSEEKDLNNKATEDHVVTEPGKMNFIMENKTLIADLPMDL